MGGGILKLDMEIESHAPIAYSCNSKIRPLLDAVDKLRNLGVMKEGIQLPTIVVVGDQSSGKSSVLESLAGISLPRGDSICTRVPLIIRLQHHNSVEPELCLEFGDQKERTNERRLSDDIREVTEKIAGSGKGISNTPVTLVVKKNGVPDLTMVDLPGITRVAIHDQPGNIYEQVRDIIIHYIKPKESIILNVLSASVDFSTCESISMSQQVDESGQRTLAVVTKCDKSPEGLLEKVTADDVKIGLGYVCVRNRIGDESYKEAREKEAKLFAEHPQLSMIDKSMVGTPILAQRLVQIQATIISKCLPDIVRNINEKLAANLSDLNKMPKAMNSIAEAMTTFIGIIGAVKESLNKLLIRGEFEEYPDNKHLHCTARLAEMLDVYSHELSHYSDTNSTANFLIHEIQILEDAKGIKLANFLPRSCFLAILRGKVDKVSKVPVDFVERVWAYIEEVLMSVLQTHSQNYHLLQSLTRRAGHNLITRMKEESMNWISELIEMERLTDYTSSDEYMREYSMLIAGQDPFIDRIKQQSTGSSFYLNGFGKITVTGTLKEHQELLRQAFDLKVRITAYWKVVLMRLVDCMALQVQRCILNIVNKEIEKEIMSELMSTHDGATEAMLEEAPLVAVKRQKLQTGIGVLKESKQILSIFGL